MALSSTDGCRSALDAILRRLNPQRPAGDCRDGMPRVPRDSAAVRQLRMLVAADPMATVLLSGHIGVGKSTELLDLSRRMESERFVVRIEIAQRLGIQNITTFSLLMLVVEALVREWQSRLGEIPYRLRDGLVVQLRNLLPEEGRFRVVGPEKPSAAFPAEAAGPKLFRDTGKDRFRSVCNGTQLLAAYFEAVERLALGSLHAEELREIDLGPMVASCRMTLAELARAADKPVLLVIDDLDKIRDDRSREDVFLARAMAWRNLPCGIVATLPLDAVFSARGPELDQIWHRPLILDPLPVPEGDGAESEAALRPYHAMLQAAEADAVISLPQCRCLAEASGGMPRNFVAACAACVSQAIEASCESVQDQHLERVLTDLTDVWRGRLGDADYHALIDVLDSYGSNVPGVLHLLREGVLLRDATAPADRQFHLAPWAEPLVQAYRVRLAARESERAR
jgi:hypothetical protein